MDFNSKKWFESCETFRDFLQFLLDIVHWSGRDRYHPNPLQFIIHLSYCHSTLATLFKIMNAIVVEPYKTKRQQICVLGMVILAKADYASEQQLRLCNASLQTQVALVLNTIITKPLRYLQEWATRFIQQHVTLHSSYSNMLHYTLHTETCYTTRFILQHVTLHSSYRNMLHYRVHTDTSYTTRFIQQHVILHGSYSNMLQYTVVTSQLYVPAVLHRGKYLLVYSPDRLVGPRAGVDVFSVRLGLSLVKTSSLRDSNWLWCRRDLCEIRNEFSFDEFSVRLGLTSVTCSLREPNWLRFFIEILDNPELYYN
jgi:hypothetical protein